RLGRKSPEGFPSRRSYSVLLPVGFAVPLPLPAARWALTPPFHPCHGASHGGLLSVALSLRSPSPDVIRHRISVEPGLSSPAAFRLMRARPPGRLAGRIKAFARQKASARMPSCRKSALRAHMALDLAAIGRRDLVHALGGMPGIVFQDRAA